MAESARKQATKAVRSRYDRVAGVYDLLIRYVEKSRLKGWREVQWRKVNGPGILEVGVGTGANFPYYPPGARVTAIDISERMLKRARDKAVRLKLEVDLQEMDVQDLRFADSTFDTVIASLVFCAVPDPLLGLREAKRVCKVGGKVVLLEHVLSARPFRAFLMNRLNPLTLWIAGENINRKTVDTVAASGLIVEQVTHFSDLFKLIEARNKG